MSLDKNKPENDRNNDTSISRGLEIAEKLIQQNRLVNVPNTNVTDLASARARNTRARIRRLRFFD